jgi:hypothetical protein
MATKKQKRERIAQQNVLDLAETKKLNARALERDRTQRAARAAAIKAKAEAENARLEAVLKSALAKEAMANMAAAGTHENPEEN